MATKLPRINVVAEPPIYQAIKRLAKKEGLSISLVARDLLREALLVYEDAYWVKEAQAREKTFIREKALKHEEVWKS